jgi:hypothetical protein
VSLVSATFLGRFQHDNPVAENIYIWSGGPIGLLLSEAASPAVRPAAVSIVLAAVFAITAAVFVIFGH